jgi:hypothetical protein
MPTGIIRRIPFELDTFVNNLKKAEQLPSLNIVFVGEVPEGLKVIAFRSSETSVNGVLDVKGYPIFVKQDFPTGGIMVSFKTSTVNSGWFGGVVGDVLFGDVNLVQNPDGEPVLSGVRITSAKGDF